MHTILFMNSVVIMDKKKINIHLQNKRKAPSYELFCLYVRFSMYHNQVLINRIIAKNEEKPRATKKSKWVQDVKNPRFHEKP